MTCWNVKLVRITRKEMVESASEACIYFSVDCKTDIEFNSFVSCLS